MQERSELLCVEAKPALQSLKFGQIFIVQRLGCEVLEDHTFKEGDEAGRCLLYVLLRLFRRESLHGFDDRQLGHMSRGTEKYCGSAPLGDFESNGGAGVIREDDPRRYGGCRYGVMEMLDQVDTFDVRRPADRCDLRDRSVDDFERN